ncbi:transglycosylase SLT domain-containing protein [Nocardia carnea]|uniref:transglycosylase SLT domain-containing protein n=1 Tax=Nocardia carnea TaxID=37328 RepID=UPI002458EAA2|nr:transglycosylase SLT domain-containing protein [Nocardia carnea]
MGDLHDLPHCAPDGLKSLFAVGEGVLQKQCETLGNGKPSEAPNMGELLRKEGIQKPDNQSVMLDRYSEHKDEVSAVQSVYTAEDEGIPVTAGAIGGVVTEACDTIDASVKSLNDQIDDADGSKIPVTDATGNQVLDSQGNPKYRLPDAVVAGLFTGLWETLDKTYKTVSGVSDRAAAAALNIPGGEPPAPPRSGYTTPRIPTFTSGDGSPSSSLMSDSSDEVTATSSGPPLRKPEGDLEKWINEAIRILQQNGVPVDESDADIIYTIIMKESSGNPNALNDWDSNWDKGTPSKGLMQTIDPTFDAHSLPGHKDIWNPVDNIIAGTRYAISRYGSLEGVPGIKAMRRSEAYVGY